MENIVIIIFSIIEMILCIWAIVFITYCCIALLKHANYKPLKNKIICIVIIAATAFSIWWFADTLALAIKIILDSVGVI